MTHLLVRRARHDSDAIPARTTSCRVPPSISYAQLSAVQEEKLRRFRKIHDAVVTLHHRANCRQGSSAQSLQNGRSGRPPTRSRSVSSSTPATRATGSQLAPNQHGLHAAFRRLQQQLEWQEALGWSPRLYGAIVEFARSSHLAKELVSCEPAVACAAPPRRNLVWWCLLRPTIRQRLGL